MPRRRFIFLCALLGWSMWWPCCPGASAARGASAAAAQRFAVSAAPLVQAPADEYFGYYRLSSLSVRNAIHDMVIEGDSPLALPGQVERIEAVRSALGPWASNYPDDPWLPDAMLRFARFLLTKQQPQYDRLALSLLQTLADRYAATPYGRQAQAQMQTLELAPDFDLLTGYDVRSFPLIFETGFVAVGANRRRRF